MEEKLAMVERIGQLSASAARAHERVDDLSKMVKEAMKELTEELKELNKTIAASGHHANEIADLKKTQQDLRDHMNRSKGWAAAGMLAVSIITAFVTKLLMK